MNNKMFNKKKKFERLDKKTDGYDKRVAHPFEQNPEKNNEIVTTPPPPTLSPTAVTITSPSNSFKTATAKSVMDAKIAKKRAEKRLGFKTKQYDRDDKKEQNMIFICQNR